MTTREPAVASMVEAEQERWVAMAARVARVEGVVGVVLGGSRARGDHTPASDVDLGLYYRGDLDVEELRGCAAEWGNDPAVVTRPGEWGPWVDGGAWLRVDGVAVDWIYRDVERVAASIAAAQDGRTARHAQAGHPFGVPEHAYAAELALGRVLADPDEVLVGLRQGLTAYPPALRDALIGDLWTAEFHVAAARKGVPRGDAVYVAACLADAFLVAAHAVHGAAGRWVSNEKGLVKAAGRLAPAPADFTGRAERILAELGRDALAGTVERAAALVADVGVAVRPYLSPERVSPATK